MLQDFVSVFHRETDKLVEVLKKYDGREVNVIPLSAQFALYCIAGKSKYLKYIYQGYNRDQLYGERGCY